MTTEGAVTVSGFSLGCAPLDFDLSSTNEPFLMLSWLVCLSRGKKSHNERLISPAWSMRPVLFSFWSHHHNPAQGVQPLCSMWNLWLDWQWPPKLDNSKTCVWQGRKVPKLLINSASSPDCLSKEDFEIHARFSSWAEQYFFAACSGSGAKYIYIYWTLRSIQLA